MPPPSLKKVWPPSASAPVKPELQLGRFVLVRGFGPFWAYWNMGLPLAQSPGRWRDCPLLDRDRGLGGAEMGMSLALSSGEAARVNCPTHGDCLPGLCQQTWL